MDINKWVFLVCADGHTLYTNGAVFDWNFSALFLVNDF